MRENCQLVCEHYPGRRAFPLPLPFSNQSRESSLFHVYFKHSCTCCVCIERGYVGVGDCAECTSNLAGVLCDIIQAGGQQVIFHGHVQMSPVFIRQQGVQVSCRQGQHQKTTILDQFCPKEGTRDKGILILLIFFFNLHKLNPFGNVQQSLGETEMRHQHTLQRNIMTTKNSKPIQYTARLECHFCFNLT